MLTESKQTVSELLARMPELVPVPRKKSSAEIIEDNRKAIIGLLKAGYSYKNIADFLTDNGHKISSYTIQSVIKGGTKKSRKPKQDTQVNNNEGLS
jgi:hypothetical protein